jgi:DNA-directed RNA polymerase subunit N (RpoN/RPB10)
MLIRIRCHTCGALVGDKYPLYVKKVQQAAPTETQVPYFDKAKQQKTIHGLILDEMGVTRMCCRMAFLTHIG